MRILEKSFKGPVLLSSSVVAVGSFDGVHSGHKELLRALREVGDAAGLQTAVVTFDPLPKNFINPTGAPKLLCGVEARLRLLSQTGYVDNCYVLPFNKKTQQQSAEDFFINVLVGQLGMRALVVGENFVCGEGRRGDITYLNNLGKQHGVDVLAQPLHALSGSERCSSTQVRKLVESGKLEQAARLLERPHEITGVVLGQDKHFSSTKIKAVVDKGYCAPPMGEYFGTLFLVGESNGWRSGRLSISGDSLCESQIVELVTREDPRAKVGDVMAIRFQRSVHVSGAK